MELRALSDRIIYIPATEQPLSADVGIIHGDRFDWIFDVGSSSAVIDRIQELEKEKKVVLSHFHIDHVKNLERISYNEMYCGAYTSLKLHKGTEVCAPITLCDGVKLRVFPIPPLHSKGAIGLEVNEEYAFLGDAIYGTRKQGREAYNVNCLKETITALESLKAQYFLISHDPAFIHPKEQIISELKKLYDRRDPSEAFLFPET